ncbi:MAG: DUF2975 domain-containing protein [Alphaproteobacteria bacterium]|nr:DUF2975 domain-containing protein [Alphaproteobacteria bacterium]MDE2072487.1 DUF2975 domain-containing protein [Alphaproteobacteria bacterium]
MGVSPRLVKASRIMARLSLAGAILYVAGDIFVFLMPDAAHALGTIRTEHTGVPITAAIPFAYRLAALVVEMIPTALMAWALIELYRLFQHYAKGEVFSVAALGNLNRVAALMFWQVLVSILCQPPISYILSFYRGAGHREISLGLGSNDLSFLFMAGVVLVIARVMAEARRMADENESFV